MCRTNDMTSAFSGIFVTGLVLAIVWSQTAGAAESSVRSPVTAQAAAEKSARTNAGLAAFARSRGYTACANELDKLDHNLFRDSEYSLRAFMAESNASERPFSALVDSRKADQRGGFTRSLTHLVVAPGAAKGDGCTTMYEQTLYHDQHCDIVRKQMAPGAKETGATPFGSITLELLRNMTITIMPVGQSQCVTVVKEVSY